MHSYRHTDAREEGGRRISESETEERDEFVQRKRGAKPVLQLLVRTVGSADSDHQAADF